MYPQSRPFGVALLIAGVDENGPQLFHVDPSGTFMRYDAKSIGSGSEGAQTELQDSWHKVGQSNRQLLFQMFFTLTYPFFSWCD